MSRKDHYYNKAKQEGYPSRAAYKLQQLDELEGLLSAGDTVVDLGAAPGGWLAVAAEAVGEDGRVVGVDIQRFNPPTEYPAEMTTVQGDMTESGVRDRIRAELPGGTASVVISDMAPEMTGEYSLDQARSLYLAETAFDTACELLESGGHLAIKVFEGDGVAELRERMGAHFEYVGATSPDASRDASAELYLIGKRYLDVPVVVGETHTVEIEAIGEEGDGLATIEGYSVFVPDTDVDDEVVVEIEDIKASFGFARVVE